MSWGPQDDIRDCYPAAHTPVRVIEEWPALSGIEWGCEECGRALDWDDIEHLIGEDYE